MDKFRLPRKTKKLLKKTLWLYPPDEQGSSLMAFPSKSETDYIALKKGIVREFPERSKAERKIFKANLDKEIYIDDRVLETYVSEIIREDLRYSFYQTLLQAKNNKKAIQAYFNFINAYHLYKDGEESYGNICCLAVDRARELLKTPAKHRRRK